MALPIVVRRFASLLAATASAGCISGPGQYVKPGYSPPRSIAVLPFNNHTTDLDGPDAVRYWLADRLSERKGYSTLGFPDMDAKLKTLGITDGGQLSGVTAQQLGEALGAEAILYGDLLECTYQTTGFVNVRKVKARFRMIDSRSGQRLWEAEGLGANSQATTSPSAALRMGIGALGTQLAQKAAHNPLREEIWDMI